MTAKSWPQRETSYTERSTTRWRFVLPGRMRPARYERGVAAYVSMVAVVRRCII